MVFKWSQLYWRTFSLSQPRRGAGKLLIYPVYSQGRTEVGGGRSFAPPFWDILKRISQKGLHFYQYSHPSVSPPPLLSLHPCLQLNCGRKGLEAPKEEGILSRSPPPLLMWRLERELFIICEGVFKKKLLAFYDCNNALTFIASLGFVTRIWDEQDPFDNLILLAFLIENLWYLVCLTILTIHPWYISRSLTILGCFVWHTNITDQRSSLLYDRPILSS